MREPSRRAAAPPRRAEPQPPLPFRPCNPFAQATDRQAGALSANHERLNARQAAAYREALEERNPRNGNGLDLDTALAVIKAAARERRFLTYGDIAEANGLPNAAISICGT